MRQFCIIMACVFGLLAVILFFSSVTDVNGLQVANMQGTVFCAACAVLCVVNVIGASILSNQEDIELMIKGYIKDQQKKESVQQKAKLPQKAKSIAETESDKPVEPKRIVKTSDNSDWVDDGDNYVICPGCNDRMSIDFIRARKKCPNCGTEYMK